MEKVILMSESGGYVVSGKISPFNEPPGVIIWGERYFTYDVTDEEKSHIYVEAFAVTLVTLD